VDLFIIGLILAVAPSAFFQALSGAKEPERKHKSRANAVEMFQFPHIELDEGPGHQLNMFMR
jgi:hypothetical protein